MLEILAVAWLCGLNAKHAVARGRKPGLFVFFTIFFWIFGEFLGGVIGGILGLEMATYILALGLGILGGVASYFLAKNCKTGDYVPKVKEKAVSVASGDAPRFCENCGAKLTAGSLFCQNCGTKVPNAMPEVTPQTPIALPKKEPHAFSKAPYLLGYTAMILWCGIFGLHFIPGLPLIYQPNSSILLTYTLLAVAAALFWKRGLSHNVTGFLFTAFFAVTNVINPVLNMMNQKNINRFKLSDFHLVGGYWTRILQTLLVILVAVGSVFLLQAVFKKREKNSDLLFALAFSGVVFLIRLLLDFKNLVGVFTFGSLVAIFNVLVSHLLVLLAIFAVLFALIFMEKVPNKGGKNSVWGIIWCILCMMACDTTAVLGVVGETVITSYAFVAEVALLAAFIFLLAKRKFAFSLIAVLPILNVLIQLSATLYGGSFGNFSVLGLLMTAFGAAANIFLTWLLLIREKKNGIQ